MIVSGTIAPKRLPRVFAKPTWISIQVIGAAIVQIGHDQTEASAGNGGLLLGSANTGGTVSQPFGTWWQGELWYSATVDNTLFNLVITTDY